MGLGVAGVECFQSARGQLILEVNFVLPGLEGYLRRDRKGILLGLFDKNLCGKTCRNLRKMYYWAKPFCQRRGCC